MAEYVPDEEYFKTFYENRDPVVPEGTGVATAIGDEPTMALIGEREAIRHPNGINDSRMAKVLHDDFVQEVKDNVEKNNNSWEHIKKYLVQNQFKHVPINNKWEPALAPPTNQHVYPLLRTYVSDLPIHPDIPSYLNTDNQENIDKNFLDVVNSLREDDQFQRFILDGPVMEQPIDIEIPGPDINISEPLQREPAERRATRVSFEQLEENRVAQPVLHDDEEKHSDINIRQLEEGKEDFDVNMDDATNIIRTSPVIFNNVRIAKRLPKNDRNILNGHLSSDYFKNEFSEAINNVQTRLEGIQDGVENLNNKPASESIEKLNHTLIRHIENIKAQLKEILDPPPARSWTNEAETRIRRNTNIMVALNQMRLALNKQIRDNKDFSQEMVTALTDISQDLSSYTKTIGENGAEIRDFIAERPKLYETFNVNYPTSDGALKKKRRVVIPADQRAVRIEGKNIIVFEKSQAQPIAEQPQANAIVSEPQFSHLLPQDQPARDPKVKQPAIQAPSADIVHQNILAPGSDITSTGSTTISITPTKKEPPANGQQSFLRRIWNNFNEYEAISREFSPAPVAEYIEPQQQLVDEDEGDNQPSDESIEAIPVPPDQLREEMLNQGSVRFSPINLDLMSIKAEDDISDLHHEEKKEMEEKEQASEEPIDEKVKNFIDENLRSIANISNGKERNLVKLKNVIPLFRKLEKYPQASTLKRVQNIRKSHLYQGYVAFKEGKKMIDDAIKQYKPDLLAERPNLTIMDPTMEEVTSYLANESGLPSVDIKVTVHRLLDDYLRHVVVDFRQYPAVYPDQTQEEKNNDEFKEVDNSAIWTYQSPAFRRIEEQERELGSDLPSIPSEGRPAAPAKRPSNTKTKRSRRAPFFGGPPRRGGPPGGGPPRRGGPPPFGPPGGGPPGGGPPPFGPPGGPPGGFGFPMPPAGGPPLTEQQMALLFQMIRVKLAYLYSNQAVRLQPGPPPRKVFLSPDEMHEFNETRDPTSEHKFHTHVIRKYSAINPKFKTYVEKAKKLDNRHYPNERHVARKVTELFSHSKVYQHYFKDKIQWWHNKNVKKFLPKMGTFKYHVKLRSILKQFKTALIFKYIANGSLQPIHLNNLEEGDYYVIIIPIQYKEMVTVLRSLKGPKGLALLLNYIHDPQLVQEITSLFADASHAPITLDLAKELAGRLLPEINTSSRVLGKHELQIQNDEMSGPFTDGFDVHAHSLGGGFFDNILSNKLNEARPYYRQVQENRDKARQAFAQFYNFHTLKKAFNGIFPGTKLLVDQVTHNVQHQTDNLWGNIGRQLYNPTGTAGGSFWDDFKRTIGKVAVFAKNTTKKVSHGIVGAQRFIQENPLLNMVNTNLQAAIPEYAAAYQGYGALAGIADATLGGALTSTRLSNRAHEHFLGYHVPGEPLYHPFSTGGALYIKNAPKTASEKDKAAKADRDHQATGKIRNIHEEKVPKLELIPSTLPTSVPDVFDTFAQAYTKRRSLNLLPDAILHPFTQHEDETINSNAEHSSFYIKDVLPNTVLSVVDSSGLPTFQQPLLETQFLAFDRSVKYRNKNTTVYSTMPVVSRPYKYDGLYLRDGGTMPKSDLPSMLKDPRPEWQKNGKTPYFGNYPHLPNDGKATPPGYRMIHGYPNHAIKGEYIGQDWAKFPKMNDYLPLGSTLPEYGEPDPEKDLVQPEPYDLRRNHTLNQPVVMQRPSYEGVVGEFDDGIHTFNQYSTGTLIPEPVAFDTDPDEVQALEIVPRREGQPAAPAAPAVDGTALKNKEPMTTGGYLPTEKGIFEHLNKYQLTPNKLDNIWAQSKTTKRGEAKYGLIPSLHPLIPFHLADEKDRNLIAQKALAFFHSRLKDAHGL